MFPKEILPVIDQPEQVQEQAFTPDLRIPKTVLWSLRRNKSLGSLTETDEGRIGVLSMQDTIWIRQAIRLRS